MEDFNIKEYLEQYDSIGIIYSLIEFNGEAVLHKYGSKEDIERHFNKIPAEARSFMDMHMITFDFIKFTEEQRTFVIEEIQKCMECTGYINIFLKKINQK